MAVNPVLIDVKAKNSAAPVLNQLNHQLKKTEKQGKAVDRQFRIVRGGMGQMGHQVQDIAVMLQSGQNPFIIIGQRVLRLRLFSGRRARLWVHSWLLLRLLPHLCCQAYSRHLRQ